MSAASYISKTPGVLTILHGFWEVGKTSHEARRFARSLVPKITTDT